TDRDSYTDLHHFYRAMRIYSAKRNKEKFNLLYFLIIPAIYLREGVAIVSRFCRKALNNK
ncbi:MAG TPA: hypothetical protein VJ963_00220, partial [Bacteroidales bacterium]|nr:hypothetical protein [Bacteroidales bacterium]